ncbi:MULTISPECIES: NADH-quinone oxidoreductase subunit J [Bacteria]|jgi:NADH:ubiquinone oxidoreductase subunit 6 (subunit J)
MNDVVFWVLGVLAVAAGVAVFRTDSMARATYALAVSFIAVGVQVVLLEQSYLGVVVILMMIMEMAIMAVFMVMYMGMNPALMPMSMVHSKRAALIVSVAAFLVLGAGALFVPWPTRPLEDVAGVTEAIGEAAMESKMLVMLAISPAMLTTIVAGVVLTHPRSRYDRFNDDLRGAASEPKQGGPR